MDAHIQLEERVDEAGDLYRASGNVLADRLLGATLHSFPVGDDEGAADAALERLAGARAGAGRRPYRIHSAPGCPAKRPPLGGLGYVVAAEEVATQARALGIGFDAVVCASSSRRWASPRRCTASACGGTPAGRPPAWSRSPPGWRR